MKRFDTKKYKYAHFWVLEFFQQKMAYYSGKGYGAKSIKKEVKNISLFMGESPRLAVDIGGNIGDYSVALREKFPFLDIHIFEPSKVNVEKLRNLFSSQPNIKVVPSAVSDTSGTATLYTDEFGSGLASLSKRKLEHFEIFFDKQEEINTIRFEDYWIHELKSQDIDLVKMDIEGHELTALNGFGNSLNSIKVIQFEFGGCNIDSRTFFQDFYYFFVNNNYDLYRITPLGLLHIRYYHESYEHFQTTNYIGINKRYY